MGRRSTLLVAAAVLAACSSDREAARVERPTFTEPTTSASATTEEPSPTSSGPVASSDSAAVPSTEPATSTTLAPTTTTGLAVTVTAVAGTAGEPEAAGPPFAAEPFAEAVRLTDGTCEGWADSRGGSTAGLAVGAPVVLLDVEANEEIGSGSIEASRWEDVSDGGEQWNCFFDVTATLTEPHAEFRIKVGALEPWLARPDPSDPSTYVASVNSDASIGQIESCPALPPPPSTATTVAGATTTSTSTTTTAAPAMVTGWRAVGQYWSRGVDALCTAGLPVTAIARPCRPEGVGSEYISAVVDSADPTEIYSDGAAIPKGTALTVVVATGRLCD